MLTNPNPARRFARQPQSLKQEYEEFVLQRIEEYKDQLSRGELLSIADDAVRELEGGLNDQLVLTEVLMLEHVDRLIMRRLNLPTFRRWREKHLKLRRAQQEPTRWGLPSDTPIVSLVNRLEGDELALVVGASATAEAMLLCACEANVLLIDCDLAAVEAAENRASAETLGARFQGLVVNFGGWLPDVVPALVVLQLRSLVELDPAQQHDTVEAIQGMTQSGGVHCILGVDHASGAGALKLATLRSQYSAWIPEGPIQGRVRRLLFRKP